MKHRMPYDRLEQKVRDLTESLEVLKNSERRFRTIAQNSTNILLESDTNGCITYANETALEILEQPADRILGKKLSDILPPGLSNEALDPDHFIIHSPQKVIEYEGDMCRRNGNRLWIVLKHKALRNSNNQITGFLTVGTDNTKRRQIRDRLKASEKYLFDIINFLPDATFVIDVNGNVVVWNHAMEQLSGVDAETILGKGNFEYSLPFYGDRRPILIDLVFKSVDELKQSYALIQKRNNSIVAEAPIQTPDGNTLYLWGIAGPLLDEQGHIMGAIESLRDMTEQRKIEYAIRESEEQYRKLVDTMTDGLIVRDKNSKITFVNDRLCEIWGTHRKNIIKNEMENFLDDENRTIFEEQMINRAQGIYEPYEITWTRPDGSKVDTMLAPKSVFDPAGNFSYSFAVVTDITDRKRAERELARQALELARSNSELEQFAYVASHDLQEPLRKIQAFGERFRARCSDNLNAQGIDYLTRMQDASKRMQTLINDLLNFSRVTSRAQPFARVNLETILQYTLINLELLIEETRGQIEKSELPVIDGDPTQLGQLLQNLIGNGLKFHRDGVPPVIKINARTLPGRKNKATAAASSNTLCELTIEDNGIGFDQKYADRIFGVFQRLHSRDVYKGTGIGLAICRKIAERHHGSIKATSAPGKGSKFIVTLPVQQPDR